MQFSRSELRHRQLTLRPDAAPLRGSSPMDVTPESVRSRLAPHADDVAIGEKRREADGYAVYDARLDGESLVCTTTLPGAEHDLHRPPVEAAACRAVATTGSVRPPDVVVVDPETLVVDAPDGDRYDPDAPPVAREQRLRTLGAALARLHEETDGWFCGCGDLGRPERRRRSSKSPVLVREPVPWDERFSGRVEEWTGPLEGTRNEDLGRAIGEAVATVRERGLFDDLDPALVHGWPKLLDVRFGDGAGGAPDRDPTIGLEDWSAAAAPPEVDLAHLRLDGFEMPYAGEEPAAWPAVLAGYRSERTPPRGSTTRRRLYRAGLTAKYLPRLVEGARSGGLEDDPTALSRTLRSYALECLEAIDGVDAGTPDRSR